MANTWDYTISAYSIDDKGLLQPNGGVYTNVKLLPMVIAHPSGRFLYTASRTVDTLPAYRIDPVTGKLTELEGSPFNANIRSPFQYSFHPNGKFLYMAARSGAVAGYRVDLETGALTPVPGSPFKAGQRTRCLDVHPSGKFVYATNAYTNDISVYRVNDKTGALTEITNSPFNAGENEPYDDSFAPLLDAPETAIGLPYYIDIHPSGKYAYVTNWRASSISMFHLDQATGDMTLIDEPVLTGLTPYPVAVHPSGKFVYVAGWASNDVWAYRVDEATGKLSLIENGQTALQGMKPVAIRFNNTGSMAYVANPGSNNVSVLKFNPDTGVLTLMQTMRARSGPIDVAVVEGTEAVKHKPKFAFVLDKKSSSLVVNKIDPKTGDFTELQRNQLGKDPQVIATSPVSPFVYVANKGSNSLSGYVVNKEDGALTPIKGFPYQLNFSPSEMVIDGHGWYLYVRDPASPLVTVYLIHRDTGQIAEVSDSPIHLKYAAERMSLDYTARFLYFTSPEQKKLSVYRHLRSITAALYEIENFGSPFAMPGRVSNIVTHPNGHYAMVLYRDDDRVALNEVHGSSGGIYEPGDQLQEVGDEPIDAVFAPNGEHAYVLSRQAKEVTIFNINALTGHMKPSGAQLKLKHIPSAIHIDPSGRFVYVLNEEGKPIERFIRNDSTGELTGEGYVAESLVPVSLSITDGY